MPIYPNIDASSEGQAGPYEGIPQLVNLWKELNPIDLTPGLSALGSMKMGGEPSFIPTDRRKYRPEMEGREGRMITPAEAQKGEAKRSTRREVKDRESLAMKRTEVPKTAEKEWKTVIRGSDPETILELVARGVGVKAEDIRKRMPGPLSGFKFKETEAGPDPERASYFEWVYRLAEQAKLAAEGGTDPKATMGKAGAFKQPMTGGVGDIENMIRAGASFEQAQEIFPKLTPQLYKSLSEYLDIKNAL